MISMFNNTKTTWAVEPMRNETMSKIKFTKKMGDDKTKSFELVTNKSIAFNDKFTTMKNMTEPVTVATENTEVRFLKKTSAPMIVPNINEKFKRDILLISVTMYGQVLKSIGGKNSYVLNYMIAKGELIMAVSINGGDNDDFSFVLHNTEDHTETTYVFAKDLENGDYVMTKGTHKSEEEITAPVFKIKKFRPNQPTHLICADIKDKKKLESMPKIKPDKFDIIYAKDSVEAIKHLESKLTDGYKAVTVFGASKSFFGTYKEIMDFIDSKFRIVNILRYDGGIMRR